MTPPPTRHWEQAQEYLQRGQLPAAKDMLRELRALDPTGIRTALLAARIDWREGRLGEAAQQALAAAHREVDDSGVALDLITTLRTVGEMACAHAVFIRTDWQALDTPDGLYRLAITCQGFGEHGRALALFDTLAAHAPRLALWQLMRAQQLEYLGRLDEAAAACEACLAASPGLGYAAYMLVRLRPQTSDRNDLRLIDAGLPHAQPHGSAAADFGFARYHVLEALGRTDDAWRALTAANAAMDALGLANVDAGEAGLRRDCERMAAQPMPAGNEAPPGATPIFIIGLPRSGTTVLECMLGNHSQVTAAGELTDFGMQLIRVLGQRNLFGDEAGAGLATLDHAQLGRRYLAQTAWRTAGRRYFVDKQPTNWMLVGLLQAALPQAKILHLVRDAMDTGFSLWRARFPDAHAWSYRLDAVPRHMQTYLSMMDHWRREYPDAILDVDYAALVRQPAATLRDVMAFCGLEWEAGCEDLARNTTPVRTLSSAQVREPVNTRGLGHWQRYAQQLEPLRQALARA